MSARPLWDGLAEIQVQAGGGHQSEVCGFGVTCWRVAIKAGEIRCVERAAGGSGGNLGHTSGHGQAEGSWGFEGGFGLARFRGERRRPHPEDGPAQGVTALKADTIALQ